MKKLYRTLLAICLLFSFAPTYASHIAGGEIYYEWVSGYTYKVTVVIYGDCAGSVYYTLPSSSLGLNTYNGTTLYETDTLPLQSITPIATTCATDSLSTVCHGGTLLGLSAAVFSKNITLPGPSANWEFNFYGDLVVASGQWAFDITNLPVTDVMGLIATLDNSAYTGSSARFAAPPLFTWSVNQPASYWSAPYDADGDSLRTVLIDNIWGNVPSTYKVGYSGAYPVSTSYTYLDTVHGIFSFDPNMVQRPAIAEQIQQYRYGKLIGTVMRAWAMTISNTPVNVLNTKIGNTSHSVTALDTTYAQVYKDTGSVSYQVVCSNPDSNNVTMEAFNLPPHAVFTVTGNGTKHPVGNIVWKTDSIAVDSYSFLIRVTDDGCPYPASYTQVFRTVVKKATAVADIKANNTIAVYPNPADKYIQLKGIKANKVNLTILRSDGTVVKTVNNYPTANAIDISFLRPGIYCLMVNDENSANILKTTFVKQ
jgi:hypothetical protein